ncbi:hypothetical protein LUZ60_001936 [Juncus effusus]|nr:hypothetical protein LUZ60_001936 [Juncus effusus]
MSTTFPLPFSLSSSPLLRPPLLLFQSPQLHFRRPTKLRGSLMSQYVKAEEKALSSVDGDEEEEEDEESLIHHFGPTEPEDEARKKSWDVHGWAPWEEVLTPEADFAIKSLEEGMEVPLVTEESIEAFRMLTPSYWKKKVEEMGEEYFRKLFEIRGEIPEKLKTLWAGPLALRLVPPRDWPPKGWEVDKAELEFIREAHKMQAFRVDIEGERETETERESNNGEDDWAAWSEPEEVFLRRCEELKEMKETGLGQYEELWENLKQWVEENREKLKTEDSKSTNPNEYWSEFRKFVDENREGGLETEKAVEKALERYNEFMKRFEQKVGENREKTEDKAREKMKGMALERYNMFLKQYTEWVEANRDKLEEESYKYDQDYYPGRRKRGKDYKEEMLELPFVYPGQIYQGKVISIALHQGAFVDIGCVHDGWVPIKSNDWYWLRHHIKVGMQVMVEIIAKRDPYRYRFPIEMRFVSPNIDHLVFKRFEYPPMFQREEDTNRDELRREGERAPLPKKRPRGEVKIESQPLVSNHPYVDELWRIHNAEQMILDHEEENPEKYKDKKYEETVDLSSYDEENSIEHTQAYYQETLLPKTIVHMDINDLDLDAARAERQRNKRLEKEAEERGEKFKILNMRRNKEMDEYDYLHWKRSKEEREALIRDISNRLAVGLPVEEPGKYIDDPKFWGKEFDKANPVYRADYWGNPDPSVRSTKEYLVKEHNREILGEKAVKWNEVDYSKLLRYRKWKEVKEDKERRERVRRGEKEEKEEEGKEEGEYDDGIDFDYRVLGRPGREGERGRVGRGRPVVNGNRSRFRPKPKN